MGINVSCMQSLFGGEWDLSSNSPLEGQYGGLDKATGENL